MTWENIISFLWQETIKWMTTWSKILVSIDRNTILFTFWWALIWFLWTWITIHASKKVAKQERSHQFKKEQFFLLQKEAKEAISKIRAATQSLENITYTLYQQFNKNRDDAIDIWNYIGSFMKNFWLWSDNFKEFRILYELYFFENDQIYQDHVQSIFETIWKSIMEKNMTEEAFLEMKSKFRKSSETLITSILNQIMERKKSVW